MTFERTQDGKNALQSMFLVIYERKFLHHIIFYLTNFSILNRFCQPSSVHFLLFFKIHLPMASLLREVDSWSSGEVWRRIMEGTEDLKSEKLKRNILT